MVNDKNTTYLILNWKSNKIFYFNRQINKYFTDPFAKVSQLIDLFFYIKFYINKINHSY